MFNVTDDAAPLAPNSTGASGTIRARPTSSAATGGRTNFPCPSSPISSDDSGRKGRLSTRSFLPLSRLALLWLCTPFWRRKGRGGGAIAHNGVHDGRVAGVVEIVYS
jgi:hypothetical protein